VIVNEFVIFEFVIFVMMNEFVLFLIMFEFVIIIVIPKKKYIKYFKISFLYDGFLYVSRSICIYGMMI
jgi:hypothetical protein